MVIKFVKQYPMIAFFGLAFGFSWLLGAPAALFPDWPEILTFLTVLGPAVGALVVVGLVEGNVGIQQLLSPLKTWRVGLKWYLVVLLGPTLMMGVTISLYRVLGRGPGIPDSIHILPMLGQHFLALLIIFLYQFIIIWGEEIGWRGFALPRLQKKYHPLFASVVLGVLWGLWHLPSFWIAGSVHQSMSVQFFVLASIGYSILYTWIYNGTRGSLLMMCLLHAANNTTVSYTMLFFKPILEEPVFTLVALGLFVLLIILLAGPKLLWKSSSTNLVPGGSPTVGAH